MTDPSTQIWTPICLRAGAVAGYAEDSSRVALHGSDESKRGGQARGVDGMPPKDPDHHRRLKREHAARKFADPAIRRRRRELNTLAKQSRSDWNDRIKSRIGCAVCGETRPDRLDWHHMESDVKRADVSALVADRAAIGRIMAEILACVCLCGNCHRDVERDGVVLVQGSDNGQLGLRRARRRLQTEMQIAEDYILKAHPQSCFGGDMKTLHRFFRYLLRPARRRGHD